METNPYKSPKSDVSQNETIDVPEQITKNIRNGWIAGIISGVMTLVMVLIAINTGRLNNIFNIWVLVDVVFIFALTYGIYKKSRFAATTMFLYFLASKILITVETGNIAALTMGVIFLYLYLQAMLGTYQYHKLIKTTEQQQE